MEREARVPVIIGNYAPLRLILRDTDSWEPTINEINSRSYDYVRLHRLSTFVDVGIAPLSLGVCFDGTLVLPATDTLQDSEICFSKFNQFISELFFGGVYCEALSPLDIGRGSLSHTAYCRGYGGRDGAEAGLHHRLRTTHAGPLDTIQLLSPPTLRVEELHAACQRGRDRLARLEGLSAELVLHAATFLSRRLWSESLIHSWTAIEQVIGLIWKSNVIKSAPIEGIPPKSRKAFLEDYRTWGAASRLELLFRMGLLPEGTYARLDDGRKARNKFVHEGDRPSASAARSALDGFLELGSLHITDSGDASVLADVQHAVAEQTKDREPRGGTIPADKVSHWLAIPPIPGDSNWGDRDFEIIEELQLEPL